MKKNKKAIFSAISSVVLAISSLAPITSQAYSFPVPYGSLNIDSGQMLSMSQEIMQQAENRYGFNEDVWRSAKRKVNAPRVEVFFDNTNPKPGEKVTAHAVPEFFKNDPQNLYYTWYLIHTKNGTSETATNSISEGKEEAAGILARGDYDPALDDQNYGGGSRDPDKDGWPAVDDNSYDEDTTAAPMGGADGVGGLTEEIVEAFSSAAEWCDSLGDHTWDKCSYYDEEAYKPLDTYFTLKTTQTNHYCNLCKDYFSGNGLTAYTTAKSTRNSCCYNNTTSTDCVDSEGNPVKCAYDANTDYCGVSYSSLFDSCYGNFKESNKSNVSGCLNIEYDSCKTEWATVHQDTDGDGLSDLNEEDTTQVSRCYKHNFGTNSNASIFRENELSSSATSDESGLDFSVSCKHKWSNASGYKSGSGKFSTDEEEFWSTDPRDPDTDGDGFPDEADIIGLGQDTFTWTYQAGDRVGVVVEGTSMLPTDEKNAYYKIMWGYLDVCDATKKDLMNSDQCEDDGDEGFGYLATKSPSEEFPEEKLKASLSFSPENPIADPSNEETLAEADQIDIVSSLDNTTISPANLYYSWYIQKEDPGSKTGWGGKMDLAKTFTAPSPSAGIGIPSFSFTPKKEFFSGESADIVRIKVTLAVSKTAEASDLEKETLGRDVPKRGYASVEIPINRSGIRLALHKVDIKDGKAVVGEEICDEGLYKLMCPAVKGQMLAAKISGGKYNSANAEFSWSLNETAFSPPANYTELFRGWNETTIFFPVTKEPQELENISLTAVPKDKLQPVMGNRLITVVEPALFIKSSNEKTSWPMTFTVEDENTPYLNEEKLSEDAFEATAGTEVSYYLDFVPYYLLGSDTNTLIDWSVNGTSLSDVDFYANNLDIDDVAQSEDGRQLTITLPAAVGTYSTIGAEVKKYWSEEENKISSTAWGIAPRSLAGESAITVATVNLPDDEEAMITHPKQILAAIGTHLPHYLMYNLRLALTLLVMFFVSAGFYAISQRIGFDYDKK